MRTVFLALTLYFMCLNSALAVSSDNTYTHHTAFAVPEQSYRLAATWFLPDWQAGISTRTDTAPAGSGDRHDLTCSVYGGCLGIPANTTCSDDFTVDGKTCYKSCSCKSGFVPASSSDICKGCYNPCDGLTDKAPCTYGCQKEYSACQSKCETCYPDNCRNRTAVSTPYGCEKWYSDCPSKCEKAYADNCRNRTGLDCDYGCQSNYKDCTSKCEICKTCSKTDCSSFTLTTIPANAVYDSCTPGCGDNTTRYKITKCNAGYELYTAPTYMECLSDICPENSSKTACSADQTLVWTYSTDFGTDCYECKDICKNIPDTSEWYAGTLEELKNNLGITIVPDWYTTADAQGVECKIENIMVYTTRNDGRNPDIVTDTCGTVYTRLCHPYYPEHGWTTTVPVIPTNEYGEHVGKLLTQKSCGTNYYCTVSTCDSESVSYRGQCVRYADASRITDPDNDPLYCVGDFISAYDGGYKCFCRNTGTCKSYYGAAAGYSCVKGECVKAAKSCSADNDCTNNDVCDPGSKKCVTRTSCSNNAQCQQSLGSGWCNYGECHYQWNTKTCYYDYDCDISARLKCNMFMHECDNNNVYN